MLALAALLAATIVAPVRADAGVSLGLSSWYAWWDVSPDNDYSVDPKPLFGPVLPIRPPATRVAVTAPVA